MKPRNPNLDWMRKVLADLEDSRSDPRIAELMANMTEPSPNIAADLESNSEALGFPSDTASARVLRPSKR
jgi:hypothetical protein